MTGHDLDDPELLTLDELLDASRFRAALAVVRRLRSERPDDVGLGALEVVLRLYIEDVAGADAASKDLVALAPDDPAGWLAVARVGLAENDQKRVLGACRAALEIAPGLLPALQLGAESAARLGREDEARRLVAEAVLEAGDRPTVLHTAGVVELLGQRFDHAATWFRAEQALVPDSPAAAAGLADLALMVVTAPERAPVPVDPEAGADAPVGGPGSGDAAPGHDTPDTTHRGPLPPWAVGAILVLGVLIVAFLAVWVFVLPAPG